MFGVQGRTIASVTLLATMGRKRALLFAIPPLILIVVTLLIKVAAEVVVSTRRIVVRLSASWPHLDWYRRVCERLRAPLPPPVPQPSG